MRLVSDHVALPLRRQELRLEVTDDAQRLVDPQQNRTHALNPTALALWELCDGSTQPHEMVDAVCELFTIDRAQATADVERTLQRFTEAGLIEWREETTR